MLRFRRHARPRSKEESYSPVHAAAEDRPRASLQRMWKKDVADTSSDAVLIVLIVNTDRKG